MRILLVEDDSSLGATIQKWLELDGYAVDWVKRGDHGLLAFTNHVYDCVLLDRGLPFISGDELLSQLRIHNKGLAVIIITALDSVMNRISGLDLGADDYLIKPFDLEELSARIRAAIRRSSGIVQQQLCHNGVVLDPALKTVSAQGGMVVLTAKEYMVLYTLMLHPQQVFTRQQLEEKLYRWGDEVESNAVEVHIHHLRKKLGADFIRTRRNLGYSLS